MPGTLVLFENLNQIESYTGSNTPVVNVLGGVRVCSMVENVRNNIPDIPIIEHSTQMHHFRISSAKLNLFNFSLYKASCGGTSCDAIGLLKGSKSASKCACYRSDDQDGCVIGVYGFSVSADDVKFEVSQHTSKSFFQSHIKDGLVPKGMTPEDVNNNRVVKLSLSYCIKKQLDYINDHCGGFLLEGWVKRGTILDQAVVEEYSKKKDLPMVDNTDWLYHITSIKIMNENTRVNERNNMKFDFNHAYEYFMSGNGRRNQALADLPDFSVGRNVAPRRDGGNDSNDENPEE